MTYETISYDRQGSVGKLTLQRPDTFNALNKQMSEEILDVALKAAHDPDLRCFLLTGAGPAFCAGGDLKEVHGEGEHGSTYLDEIATKLHAAIAKLARMNAPVVVCVNGVAAGAGLSLVLSGDHVIASEDAKFVSAYTAAGLTPDGSSTFFLARHVGL